ncbi:MAG: glycosyltransferase [Syntrophales bacterium]
MIVKDEERLLPQCLESVKDVADEIIVVDTGSTDRTVAIAAGYGAHVYHHPWENDFSKHRNQSISYATGDWILIMDADEELEARTIPLIRPLIKNAPTGVISFNVRSYLDDGAFYSEGSSPRLFRSGRGVHYDGRIHNQIIYREALTPSPVVLWHYGYDLGSEKMNIKMDRSLLLLRQQAEERPDDIPTRHHIAMTLMAQKKWKEAYDEAARALQMAKERGLYSSQLSWTYFVAATSLISMEKFDEAGAICREGLELFDWSIDLHHSLTQVSFFKKEYEQTLEHGAAFLKLREKLHRDIGAFPIFQFETVHRDWVVYRSMGYAHLYLGHQEQGIDYLAKAVATVSKHERMKISAEIGLNLLKIGQREMAIDMLATVPPEQLALAAGGRALAGAYEDTGKKGEALRLYQKIHEACPEDGEVLFRIGRLFLETRDFPAAARIFATLDARMPNHTEALINWGLALEGQRLFNEAEGKYRQALVMDPDSPKAFLNLGLLLFQHSRYHEALPFLQRTLAADPGDIHISLALAKTALATGNIEEMLPPCDGLLKALSIPGEHTLDSLSDLADLYLTIAAALLDKGQLQAFETAVDIGLRLGPGNTAIIARLSRAALAMERRGTAAMLLESGLSLTPRDEELLRLAKTL